MIYGGAYVVFAVSCGLGAGWIARSKGQSFWIWFMIGLAVPLLGNLAAALSRNEYDEPRRSCPSCGAFCMAYDAKCMRCAAELSYPDDDQLLPSVNVARALRANGKL